MNVLLTQTLSLFFIHLPLQASAASLYLFSFLLKVKG